MNGESACGPVAVLVFKTSERGDEPRWWVRLPRALASLRSLMPCAHRGVSGRSPLGDDQQYRRHAGKSADNQGGGDD